MSEQRKTAAQQPAKDGLDRRGFFRSMGGAGALAAAAVTPLAAVEAKADESQSERTKARYQESQHVKDFYRVNRY